jgi:hypothetical protein
VQRLRDGQRASHVQVTVEQQGRNGDPGQDRAQVGVRERREHGQHTGRTDVAHHRSDEVDGLGRPIDGEERGQVALHPLGGRPLRLRARPVEPGRHLRRRQGSLPARVGPDENERTHEVRMAVVHRDRQARSERDAAQVRALDVEGGEEARDGVRVIGERHRPGRVVRPATTRRVPGDQVDGVGQLLELWAPRAAVAPPAVQQDERRPLAPAAVGDGPAANLDPFHLSRCLTRQACARRPRPAPPGSSATSR